MIDINLVYFALACVLAVSLVTAVKLSALASKLEDFSGLFRLFTDRQDLFVDSFTKTYDENANAHNKNAAKLFDTLNEVDVNLRSVQSVVDVWFNEKSGLANGMKAEVGNLSGQVAASQIVVTEKVKELKELVKSIDVKHDGVTDLFASAVDSISEDVAAIGLVVSGPAKGKPGRKPKAEKGAKAPKVSKK